MGTKKFAHDITLDFRDHSLSIDGIPFPFWIEPSPQVDLPHPDSTMMATVRIGIFTEGLTIIDEHGLANHVTLPDREADLRWARARAKEIVYEGLADIIKGLKPMATFTQPKESK